MLSPFGKGQTITLEGGKWPITPLVEHGTLRLSAVLQSSSCNWCGKDAAIVLRYQPQTGTLGTAPDDEQSAIVWKILTGKATLLPDFASANAPTVDAFPGIIPDGNDDERTNIYGTLMLSSRDIDAIRSKAGSFCTPARMARAFGKRVDRLDVRPTTPSRGL